MVSEPLVIGPFPDHIQSTGRPHAAETLATLGEQREPLVITPNGEAKAVLLDVASRKSPLARSSRCLMWFASQGQASHGLMGFKYSVLLTAGAEQDLEAIYDHIAEFDDPAHAIMFWIA